MCMSCLSNAEHLLAKAALAGWLLKEPAHRVLADLGLVALPDPVGRDARTVAFLRHLDLDPVEVLGADAVAAAEAWRPGAQPTGRRRRASASPIGSQSLITAQ